MSEIIGYAARKHFEPDKCKQLAEVLDATWVALSRTGDFRSPAKAAETRTLLAKYIIEIAKRGERSPARMQDKALEFLRRGEQARRTNRLNPIHVSR